MVLKRMAKNSIIVLNTLVFVWLLNTLPVEPNVAKGLSILVFVGVLWLTEAIHLTITALLVPLLAAFLGVLSFKQALASFADPIIFLFMGGFGLAAALSRQQLDKAMATAILRRTGGHLGLALVLLFVATAGLSMWISNTATAAMMLPLILGLLAQVKGEKVHVTRTFALLGLAYSASIGGIATLVGSPPNAIAAAATGMSFTEWLIKALPLTLLLLPAAVIVLFLLLRPQLNQRIAVDEAPFEWSLERKITLSIFAVTVFMWVFSKPVNAWLGGVDAFDSVVAVMAMVALVLFKVVTWRDMENTTDWGVLLLFGGGLCLSQVLQTTEASLFLGETVGHIVGKVNPLLAVMVVVAFVVFLTELASNTASAALLVPVFVALAPSLGVDPVIIASLIAVSASCAFMLPVATPPNAIVFGTGHVPQYTMMQVGLYLNIACVLLISFYAYWVW